jgi:Invasin, domain 3
VTVRATISRTLQGSLADPLADPGSPNGKLAFGEFTFDVNAAPSVMTLTADPASVACDGSATSKVSAALTDADGNPALSGTAVHFDVQVLGTANPIDTTTNDKGIATSVISPLADAMGVPVTVSVKVGGVVQPDLTQQILVNCAAVSAPTPAAEGGGAPVGGAAGGTTSPGGVITGPNTGTGGGVAGAGGLSWWPILGLLFGGLTLAAVRYGRLAVRRDD